MGVTGSNQSTASEASALTNPCIKSLDPHKLKHKITGIPGYSSYPKRHSINKKKIELSGGGGNIIAQYSVIETLSLGKSKSESERAKVRVTEETETIIFMFCFCLLFPSHGLSYPAPARGNTPSDGLGNCVVLVKEPKALMKM